MAARYRGEIEIGGKMSKETFIGLLSKFKDRGPKENVELSECRNGLPMLLGDDQEARGGMFESLEEWCIENKVCFLRTSAAYCEYSECVMAYTEAGRYDCLTADDEPIIDFGMLKKMVSKLAGKTDEELPLLAHEDGWVGEFAQAGLASAMDLATFLSGKLEALSIPKIPGFEVEGMTSEEVKEYIRTNLGIKEDED